MKVKAIIRAVLIALVILSGAIAAPILFRPFYWWHIGPFQLDEWMGMTAGQIKEAYGQMMDYCIGLTDTFAVGVLPFSELGASHFADVRNLFLLDLWVLVIAGILLAALCLLDRGKPIRLRGHTPGYWSAIGLIATFATVGSLASLDFNRAFTIFHKLFFPGKDNWIFDGREDPVIYMLPEEFFRNCAILILSVILLSCAGLILYDHKKTTRRPGGA